MTEPAEPRLFVEVLDEAALAYARKWKLVTEDGQVLCSRDGCTQPGTLPTLLCRQHLAAHRRAFDD